MKLYDKKFLIYENCMIRSFGQPGRIRSNVFTEESFSIFIRIPFSLFVLFIHAWEFGCYSSQN